MAWARPVAWKCIIPPRTHATALEMADGRILVAGNWYGPDALECSTAGEPFTTLKPLQPRNLPYLLQVATDNVYIFGATDHYGNPLEGSWVEQLIGEPFQEPLLQEWVTENGAMPNPPEHYILGEYRYLIPVRKQDALAFLKLDNGTFELLETAHPIPQEGPWGAIDWQYGLAVDTTAQSAWKQGRDAQGRLYLLSIGYGESPAAVQVFYSEPLEDLPYKAEVLALSGGLYATHCLVPPTPGPIAMAGTLEADLGLTILVGLCISIVAICMYAYFMRRLKGISLNIEEVGNTLLEAIAKNLDHKHPSPGSARQQEEVS